MGRSHRRAGGRSPGAAKGLAAGLLLSGALAPASVALAAPESYDGKLDLGARLKTAGERWDLENRDAVFLEKAQEVRWRADGRRELAVHEIVWIRTETAQDHYADLRIPYDSERCELRVNSLRTWRDDRWWYATDTAVVETMPEALARADDYVNVREVMLLHDGVELPCILETQYEIVDRKPFRAGIDGQWIFPQAEPAVASSFVLALPPGKNPALGGSGDRPEPVVGRDEERGLDTLTWTMEMLDPRGRPATADPAGYLPHVAWSTWGSWEKLGAHLDSVFTSAMVLEDTLRDSVAAISKEAPNDGVRAERLVEFVERSTRAVDYDTAHWRDLPRPAARTWATAYGHDLDRAVLAAALFREAGLGTGTAVLWAPVRIDVDATVPSLARLSGLGVQVGSDVYDVAHGRLLRGRPHAPNRTTWRPRPGGGVPTAETRPREGLSGLELRLARGEDGSGWTGTGVYVTTWALCAIDEMAGLETEALDHLEKVVGGALEGAEITTWNPASFDARETVVAFEFTLPEAEPDDFDRVPLVIADLESGVFSALPRDVRVAEAERGTPVVLPSPLVQSLHVVIETEGVELVRVPDEVSLENAAGSFRLAVERSDDELILTRTLALTRDEYSAADWPDLRALLLAERHERNRTLLIAGDE